jgi:hypothetical protein
MGQVQSVGKREQLQEQVWETVQRAGKNVNHPVFGGQPNLIIGPFIPGQSLFCCSLYGGR